MKRTLIFTGIGFVFAFLLLYVFNNVTTNTNANYLYTEVESGEFEIALTAVGELIAENSIDIAGPDFSRRRYVRSRHIKIQDLVPEGTEVKKGDYIASLDRTELDNSLKDQLERFSTLMANLEMKMLDTAVVLNAIRDEIKNQEFLVEEAVITLRNSKYEPPTAIRQAEIQLDKAQRMLQQRRRSYKHKVAQSKTDIYNQEYNISIVDRRVKDLEELLAGFIIKSPASGMVIYKKEWNGTKRKVGSTISPFDRVVATLPDLRSMFSKTFINEIDVSKIEEGQIVNITIDAFPEKSFTGSINTIANIGENLPNTNEKVFEVQIRIEGSDPLLRPSMTTGNKIIIKRVDNAVYVPIECVHAGVDSIPFVFTKDGNKQIVLLGDSNEKNVIVEEGLEPGVLVYLYSPETPENFRIIGKDLIPAMKERQQIKKAENESYISDSEIVP